MRKKGRKKFVKLGLIFIILLLALSSISVSHSLWTKDLEVELEINTGSWDGCIKIRKILEKGCPNKCGDKYYLTIQVMNNGTTDLTDVNVTDTIGPKATLVSGTITVTKGTAYMTGKDLTWNIGNLAVDETANLSMCLYVNYWCCNFIWAKVEDPKDTNGASSHPVNRIEENGDEVSVYYEVDHKDSSRRIRFENCDPDGLGENGKVETDTFVINVSKSCSTISVTTKAGNPKSSSILTGIGNTIVDSNNFTITLYNIVDLGGDQKQYMFKVTSDDDDDTEALSFLEFDFGKKCTIEINEGAKVTAKSLMCNLEATTKSLYLYIIKFCHPECEKCDWVIIKIIDSPTPWAEDCCDFGN